ncbi:hypothetical protein E4582_09540 [Luteimonas yindakuii]|uniref:Phasin family protein n=1 Tax=Luteimonas yindakuii TaxID=2565782 RepID=A0A4Z1RDS3_9GAMM|nr:hypothetical protein [Luteimonas yindakuii]TKS54978.1 hypothetical protein E4582_09540 [Luteimonas yindakuii]
MSMPTLPQALYKANLDLWLRIGELLEDNRTQWTALLARELDDGAAGANVDLEVLRAGDWQSLAALPAQALQRLASHGLGDLQATAQTALGGQMNFATGFQAALADWQQATAAALGDAGAGAGDLQSIIEQALQAFGAGTGAPGAASRSDAAADTADTAADAAGTGPARKAAARPRKKAVAKKAPATATATKGAARRASGNNDSGKQAARKVAKRAAPRKAAKTPAKRGRTR